MHEHIIIAPEALAQFESSIARVQSELRTGHKITTYDFRTTISASAKMSEAMLSTNTVRNVTADFLQNYIDMEEGIKKNMQDADDSMMDQLAMKLSD